jgi:hypothetical protein
MVLDDPASEEAMRKRHAPSIPRIPLLVFEDMWGWHLNDDNLNYLLAKNYWISESERLEVTEDSLAPAKYVIVLHIVCFQLS